MPVRHQRSRAAGSRLPAGTVVVSRPGRWGNPFRVGLHGTQEQVVQMHADLVERGTIVLGDPWHEKQQRLHLEHFLANLHSLVGKDVACFCRLSDPCHGDTLMRAAARLKCEDVQS